MTDVTEIQIDPSTMNGNDLMLKAEVVPTILETEAPPPSLTLMSTREPNTIIVAGTTLTIEGLDVPPENATDDQLSRRTPSGTAHNYMKVFENGDESSNPLEISPVWSQARQRELPKSGDTEPKSPDSPTELNVGSTVQLPAVDEETPCDQIVAAIKASPSPEALANEVIDALLQAYGEPDWLQRSRSADRVELGSAAEPAAVQVSGFVNDASPDSDADRSHLQLVDKYKPRKFADVVGQDAAVKFLKRCATQPAPLRLLLTGPSGSGKTSLAWIVARRWCCTSTDRQNSDPCERCEACDATREMELGDFGQIRQVSAAPHLNKLLATKNIQAELSYGRVLIVNEADQMGDNAIGLASRLDEFKKISVIFAACDGTKLEGNGSQFLNRVKVVHLGTPTVEDIAKRLVQVAGAEGVRLSDADAMQIAMDEAGVVRSPRSALIELEAGVMPE